MELFDDVGLSRSCAIPRVSADVTTPLGATVTAVMLDGRPVTGRLPDELRAPAQHVTHHLWHGNTARCELLRVGRGSRPAREVDGSVGYLWRLATWGRIESLEFTCQWRELPAAAPALTADREFEVATWSGPAAFVAIGTETVGEMVRRAEENDGFPSRLVHDAQAVSIASIPIGVTVTIFGLERHEQCQVQFMVAWGQPRAADSVRSATRRRAAELLALAGSRS